MNNEIKQRDKVRVSKDIPQFYRKYNSMRMFEQTFRVVDIEDGFALLKSTSILMYTVVLPTKYLIKVDVEAKEPKFCIGDRVRVSGGVLDGGVFTIMDRRFDGGGWIYELSIRTCIGESRLELYTEPTAPKYKKGDRVKYIGKEHPEYWGEVFTVDGEIFYNDYHKNMQISSVRCEKYSLCNVPLSDLEPYTGAKK